MSETPEQPGARLSRRNILLSGGSALAGLLLGGAGDRLLSDSSEQLEALKLWHAREKVLNNIFFSSHNFYEGMVIAGRVTLPAGRAIHTFPSRAPSYSVSGLEGSTEEAETFGNDRSVLEKDLVVENPLLMGGGSVEPITGVQWMLVDGPEGAGYVRCDKESYQARTHKEVLLGSYWSGKGHDGQLRFTAKGFAYPGGTVGQDQLSYDFNGGAPDVQRLGEGMQAAKFIAISETIHN